MSLTPLLTATLMSLSPAGASAELVPADWKRTLVMDESKRDANTPAASAVHTMDKSKTGVLLQCTGDSMSAYFAVEPLDFEKLAESRTSRYRERETRLFINGELVDERKWTYLPALEAAFPDSKLIATKIFNAIVQGQPVQFELGDKRVDVFLPQADDEFASFAEDCSTFRRDAAE